MKLKTFSEKKKQKKKNKRFRLNFSEKIWKNLKKNTAKKLPFN